MKRRDFFKKTTAGSLGLLLISFFSISEWINSSMYDDELLHNLIKEGKPIRYRTFNLKGGLILDKYDYVNIQHCVFKFKKNGITAMTDRCHGRIENCFITNMDGFKLPAKYS